MPSRTRVSTARKRPSDRPTNTRDVSFSADSLRHRQRRTLLELTQIPTAAGREGRVVEFIRTWAAARPDVRIETDKACNLTLSSDRLTRAGKPSKSSKRPGSPVGPMLITAHLDHPAFVVERIIGPATVELSFRGGVMDAYFESARIVIHPDGDAHAGARPEPIGATLVGEAHDSPPSPFGKLYLAELDGDHDEQAEQAEQAEHTEHTGPSGIRPGDVAVWALPPAQIDEVGILHAPACDDLAAVAAALEAFDALRERPAARNRPETRLLFTRAEEIGFIGAIAACKLGTIPRHARIVALENSRAFADSPVGGGPIVRVGDRLSVFSPRLTAACAKRAEELSGRPATPKATERAEPAPAAPPAMKWQRKLMAGGACEATVFCAYGHEATCLCLPLGNYHNMAGLDRVQSGEHDPARDGPPRIAREFISVVDYFGLIDLLVALGEGLPDVDPIIPRLEGLYAGKSAVLREGGPVKPARAPKRPALRSKPATKPRSRSASRTTPKPQPKPKSGLARAGSKERKR
ncbi:MAG: M20/M25/M40 family metallo-hydrolase [Phycisphaeraceae bacterium]|nr:M20/M25/M40 family metallo-hydrolase [Phycisphaeraceae bacterium]